ncbi:hypothetical protein [Streptomyces sp. NBC_00459]|uniref:hypothetical protein n=1 Tax=Streptomyces sp. NBC_00459 TaxID=2975749 RepID=UPI003FA789A8
MPPLGRAGWSASAPRSPPLSRAGAARRWRARPWPTPKPPTSTSTTPCPGPAGQLLLLHARLPGHQREALTRLTRERLGSAGERPARLVIVTTSLLDMSLDIDVDVMVSDLASLEKLLQRLGRLWRFENLWGTGADRRPAWLRRQGVPRLSILQPTDHRGRTLIPAAWRTLEPALFTHAAAGRLAGLPQRTLTLTLPDDVQHLVETVHAGAAELARTSPDLTQHHTAYQSRRRSEEHLSALHLIPTWRDTPRSARPVRRAPAAS